MWMKKDMMSIYTTMPKEHVAPLATTTILVTILRFALVVGVILLVKWIINKIKK